MKILIILFLHFQISQTIRNLEVVEKWDNFKILHGRRFINQQEEFFRMNLFLKKLQIIKEHNDKYEKGLETYKIGVNKFSDYTEEELLAQGLQLPSEQPLSLNARKITTSSFVKTKVPSHFDWRDKGMVTPVKNQMACNACWAFSATGALESHYKIYHSSNVSLSEQQLIDCVAEANGCEGGWMTDAFAYIAQNGGICSSRDYPYQDSRYACGFHDSDKPDVRIRGYAYLTEADESLLKKIVVVRGPVSVAIDGGGTFADYVDGVYYNPSCSKDVFSHAVVIVGFGTDDGEDYWVVKNSWGRDWGLDGYIKMARNRDNHCGIASRVSYPIL